MSENPSPLPTPAAPPSTGWVAPLALALALLALVAAGSLFWMMQTRIQSLELQLARRIGEFDNSSKEARTAAREVRATVDDLTTRTAALEAKAQEAQNQQLALQAMYQELARGQDERLLADIEQTLLLANQQLEMAGNVRAAVLGLDAAEARLARMKKPQFERLRAAISRDSARLKLLPAADVVGINARLDALLQNVDKLKLESDQETPPPAKPRSRSAAVDWMERLGSETWSEIKQLVRIRRLDHPDMVLLEPSQTYFLRQNLKLRLLSARLAALQRDEATYRADIAACRQWIGQYFNRSDALTLSMLQDLKELEAMPVSLQNANLNDSLGVLHSLAGTVR
ncbi:MAG TPA: uroporphyrinogen-III C-methyltransferase [Parasulfuritortus sp.]